MYIVKKTDNVPIWSLSILQWLSSNSCTCARDIQLYIAGNNEPKGAQQVKQAA